MSTRLRFLGATGTVTGSRYLVETDATRVLVDCGLYQGYKVLRERNWAPFPVPPDTIDAVFITHAHLDHTGYLPALVRDGFHGRVHTTGATADLSRLILPDSGHLQEEQASYAQRRHFTRHPEVKPLYTAEDAWTALKRFDGHPFDTDVTVGDITARFVAAGHILGAAQIHLSVGGRVVHFTGDLGREDDPLMRPPRPFTDADVLVCESTYGNRIHAKQDAEQVLAEIVTRICGRGGVVILPAFAIGRAETLLLHLSRLRSKGVIPDVPVFLNSPMAVDGSDIYRSYPEEHRLSPAEFHDMYRLATFVRTVDESKLLNLRGGPAVIISASGMLEGGRVLHHIAAYGGDPHNAIVLTGYQAGGTRGAALQRGERVLRIHGEGIAIRAEVHMIDSLCSRGRGPGGRVDEARGATAAGRLPHPRRARRRRRPSDPHRACTGVEREGRGVRADGRSVCAGLWSRFGSFRGDTVGEPTQREKGTVMRAAVATGFTEPLTIQERPIPSPGPGPVLVRLEACGLCHTDIHAVHGDWPVKPGLPFIPGHEGVGLVERLGDGVTCRTIGQRVALPWLGHACGERRYCIDGRENLCEWQYNTGYSFDGCYAEYALADARFATPVPDGIPPVEAAPLTCAGVTTYAAVKAAHVLPAERVAVFGVGGLGHLAVQYAHLVGAQVIAVDMTQQKLNLARELGADCTINAAETDPVGEIARLGGADVAIVLAVAPVVFDQAFRSLNRGGRMMLVSLPADGELSVPIFDTVIKGISIIGSIVGTRQDLAEVFALHAAGRTRVIVAERDLHDVNEAMVDVLGGGVPARLVFTYGKHQLAASVATRTSATGGKN